MTRPEQKLIERLWAERLRASSGIDFRVLTDEEAPAFAGKAGDPSQFPDLWIRHDGNDIGLEVTELHLLKCPGSLGVSSSRAEVEFREQIVRQAHDLYCQTAADTLRVDVVFRPPRDTSLARVDRKRLAQALCNFLHTTAWPRGPGVVEDVFEMEELLPIAKVFVRVDAVSGPAQWRVVQAGWARPVTDLDLAPRIDAKNRRLAAHEGLVSRCWLLMVADRASPAQMLQPPVKQLDTSASCFDRTFVVLEPGYLHVSERAQE